MSNDRESRSQEIRAAEPVHEAYGNWEDDSLLSTDNIPAREGYTQRWVRTQLKGKPDHSNVFKKANKGWRPRPMSSVPKGQFVPNVDFQGVDVVGIHGMILMERPIQLHERERQEVKRDTSLQMQAVKSDMYRVHDKNSGLTRPEFTEERTQTSRGRIAAVDD